MYKLVNVIVDSDAHGTFEFRAIVFKSVGRCYVNMEAWNVLNNTFWLNDILEIRLGGNTSRSDMVRLKRLVQLDSKFADGLSVNLRDCNKNGYSFIGLLRNDITAGLDWRDTPPKGNDDADDDADDGVVSEVPTVFGKLQIISTEDGSRGLHYSSVLESQKFNEIILRAFPWSFHIDYIKAHAECLLIQAMVAALYDSSYSTDAEVTFEKGCKKGVSTTRVGIVHIDDVVLYPNDVGHIYSCRLTFPWHSGEYVTLYNIRAERLPVEIDLLIKKKINESLSTIKYI